MAAINGLSGLSQAVVESTKATATKAHFRTHRRQSKFDNNDIMKWITPVAIVYGALATAAAQNATCQPNLGQVCGDSSQPREQNCCDEGYCMPWSFNYYQCIESPPKCPAQETDIDYAGHDLVTVYGLYPAQCCDACYDTNECVAYTFVNQDASGSPACYLKSSADGRVEKTGAVSGKLVEDKAPEKCPTVERGVDYYGNDLETRYDITIGECCDACTTKTRCSAFSFVLTYTPAGQGTCYLKTSSSGRVVKSGVVSGQIKFDERA